MRIRDEEPSEHASIRAVVEAAFAAVEHSSKTEGLIVDALRKAGALHHSLVAVEGDEILGHVAFSPVKIDGESCNWFGLGPLAVRPDRQGEGIGAALIREGLDRLRAQRARGCVVLGEPLYYGRFGFRAHPSLRLPGVPPQYFQALSFDGAFPAGEVEYHRAFSVGT